MTRSPLRVAVFGATSSIAQAVIRQYAQRGTALALVARHAEHLDTIRADAMARGARSAAVWVTDLDAIDGHDALVSAMAKSLGGIDVALVAQGSLPDQEACESNPKLGAAVMVTNFSAPATLTLTLVRVMQSAGGGTIAVLGSVAGDRGRQSNYVYGAAKAGLAVLLEGLHHRLRKSTVAVVLIKPGTVRSRMTDGLERLPLPAEPEAVADAIVRAIERRVAVAYVPRLWQPIMFMIRSLPRGLFERTAL